MPVYKRMIATAHAQPFRPFFFMAALDAIAGVAVCALAPLGISPEGFTATPLAVFHRQELLFGTVPAVLAGFILTALPRWTGRRAATPFVVRALAAVWLASRAVHVFVPFAAALAAAIFIGLLTLAVAFQVAAARDRRNFKVAILLAVLAAGAATAGSQPIEAGGEVGSRLSLAAILGLLIVFGGRIVPALTRAYLGEPAHAFPPRWETRIEAFAAIATMLAIGAWVVAPSLEATALACAVAAIGQLARLIQWRTWRIAAKPAVLVLHIGHGWIPAGFALAAASPLDRGLPLGHAAVHAWMAGGFGLCSLGVMSSMIRRHAGAAFQSPPLLSAAYACALTAAGGRLAAEFVADSGVAWLSVAAFSWIAAYILFLLVFGNTLLRGRQLQQRWPLANQKAS